MNKALMEIASLRKHFPIKTGLWGESKIVRAVDDVDLTIEEGESFGLVGESGCGKTTLGKLILRLLEPTAGKVIFDGHSLFDLRKEEMRKIRKDLQIVFQDPYSSLNPRMTVREIVGRPLELHGVADDDERQKRVLNLLEKVGLSPEQASRYPHEFSGGQRQRIAIARAIALNPRFITLDEPTSALDVSVQAQILNLLKQLQSELKLTYMLISHNLSVVRHLTDHVAVMYLGKIVELAQTPELFERSVHPYTKALVSAVPVPDPEIRRQRIVLKGDVASPVDVPPGCRFHTRCPYARESCRSEEPKLEEVAPEHLVACHFSRDFYT
jgi:oligopeptide/dipeptide ABC transporter ATP-binding protein